MEQTINSRMHALPISAVNCHTTVPFGIRTEEVAADVDTHNSLDLLLAYNRRFLRESK